MVLSKYLFCYIGLLCNDEIIFPNGSKYNKFVRISDAVIEDKIQGN